MFSEHLENFQLSSMYALMFVGKTTKPSGAEEREQEASWQALGTMETGGVRSFADRNSEN